MADIVRYKNGKVFIPPEKVEEAKAVGLYDYFVQTGVPLVRKGRDFCTADRDSLCLSTNGLWNWYSQGVGGRNAVDFLIKTEGYSFQDAVLKVLDESPIEKVNSSVRPVMQGDNGKEARELREFLQPERDSNNDMVIDYLSKRGIDSEVVNFFIDKGTLYQDKIYKSVVFLGTDRNGKAHLANVRGISSGFKGTTKGSDRAYGFNHFCAATVYGQSSVKGLHVFEAPIDLLSYATLVKMGGYDFRNFNYLSLSGIYAPGENAELKDIKTPVGLLKMFEEYPDIKTLYLHFDNDKAGINAARALQVIIPQRNHRTVFIEPPPQDFKDVNDYLIGLDGYMKNKGREL